MPRIKKSRPRWTAEELAEFHSSNATRSDNRYRPEEELEYVEAAEAGTHLMIGQVKARRHR